MKYDVTIVGAGPGGMLLAYLLAKAKYDVLLLEKTSILGQAFRGEHLNVEGENVLKKYKLFDKIERFGLLRMETLDYYSNGEKLKTIYPDEQIGHLGIHVPQKHLLGAIYNEALKLPNFHCMLGTNVKNLIQDDKGLYTTVEVSTSGVISNIQTKLIIAADGRHSTITKKLNLPIKKISHGYDLLWARIPAPNNWEPSIKMALVDGMQLSLFTQYNNFIQIGWNIPKGSYPTLIKDDFKPFIDKLIKAFPELKTTVENSIQSWKDFVLLDVFSSQADYWSKENVIVIGDAVHAFTPTGAFGLNCSLKDAEVVAELLIMNSLKLTNWETCERERKNVILEIQKKQREMEANFSHHFSEVQT